MKKAMIGLCFLGVASTSYAGMCTSEAIRVKHACTLEQFGADCKNARANWRDCSNMIRELAKESRDKERTRKHREFDERNDDLSLSRIIEKIFGIRF